MNDVWVLPSVCLNVFFNASILASMQFLMVVTSFSRLSNVFFNASILPSKQFLMVVTSFSRLSMLSLMFWRSSFISIVRSSTAVVKVCR